MKITDNKEVLIEIEKYLKTGRFSFAVLTWDNKDKAVINELIVKYDEKDGKPILYVKKPDKSIVPIITESDQNLKDFLENFIEISVDRTKNYEPSLWFMLKKDKNGNTGWNDETVQQFYDYIEDNFSVLKPYALQVFSNKQRETLIPFVGTQMVFYDMGRLMSGEGIENFDRIIEMLYKLINDIRSNLIDIMNGIETKFTDMNTKLIQENERQNKEISTLQKNMESTKGLVDDVLASIGNIRGTTERRLLPTKIAVGGNANTIYPVQIRATGGGYPIAGGTELFMGAMFLQMESPNRNIVLQIGNMHATTSPAYYNGAVDQYYVYSHKVLNGADAKHYVYDCRMITSGTYVLLLRGGTNYTLWSKYPENIDITNNLGSVGGLSPIPDTNLTTNPQLTDNNILGSDTVRTFVNSVHVVNSVMIGNKIRMGIGG